LNQHGIKITEEKGFAKKRKRVKADIRRMNPRLLLRNCFGESEDIIDSISLVLCRAECKYRPKDKGEEYESQSKSGTLSEYICQFNIDDENENNIYAGDKK
jgi:hypothetical protein